MVKDNLFKICLLGAPFLGLSLQAMEQGLTKRINIVNEDESSLYVTICEVPNHPEQEPALVYEGTLGRSPMHPHKHRHEVAAPLPCSESAHVTIHDLEVSVYSAEDNSLWGTAWLSAVQVAILGSLRVTQRGLRILNEGSEQATTVPLER